MNNEIRNTYINSSLGNSLRIFILCEIINLSLDQNVNVDVYVGCNDDRTPKIKNLCGRLIQVDNNSFNLSMYEAIIPKFVFVNLSEHVNLNDIKRLRFPTLNEVVKDLDL